MDQRDSPLIWAMRLALPFVLVGVAVTQIPGLGALPIVMLASAMLAFVLAALYLRSRPRT